ncbi:MAG: hypothetical protein KGZ66_02080 [Selenomonadales bacterium]|nr:hypothetical protein [Selenomonadales bacterium]
MANGLQRAIYNLANAVPLAAMTALFWYLEFRAWRIPMILLVSAAVVTGLFAMFFCYGKNNCSIKSITVSKVISKDPWLLTYMVAYVSPFAYMVIPDYHIVSFIVVVLMLILIFISAVMALPNILLFFVGYHFYEVETDTGVGDYLLISKRRRIRNRTNVKAVMRVFEKLLIDTKGDE